MRPNSTGEIGMEHDHSRASDNGMALKRDREFGPVGAIGQPLDWGFAKAPADDNRPLGPPSIQKKNSLLDGMDSASRKEYPITTGCLDYFRDALLLVSHVSYKGNQKHSPGQNLHWNRSKSPDEDDAIGRHLMGRFDMDPELDTEEAAQMAWRSLAFLQKLLEKKHNIKPPPACK